MPLVLKNNAASTLATAATDVDTVLVVTDGAQFPTLAAGEYFYATLAATSGTLEIVKVTARSGNALTVVRGQDDTTAAVFQVGTLVEMRVNAASVLEANTVEVEVIDGIGPAADPLQGTDFLPIAQGASNPRNTTLTGLRDWMLSFSAALSGELTFVGVSHRGLRLLNLTTAQRDALPGWANGHLLYNETQGRLNARIGGTWYSFVRSSGDTMTGPLVLPSNGLTVGTTELVVSGTNVGIGTAAPPAPLTISKGGGASPATSGTSQPGAVARLGSFGIAALDVGIYAGGATWMQAVNIGNLASSFSLILQPVGGNVGIGNANPTSKLDVVGSSSFSQGPVIGTVGATLVDVRGSAGQTRGYSFRTGVDLRWVLALNTTAETGSNTGSDIDLYYYNDAGTFGGTAIRVARSNGAVSIFSSLSVSTSVTAGGNITTSGGVLRPGTFTVATLPAAATAGAGGRASVTDANATTFNSIVAGGGANFVPVFSDGTNWRIG